MNLCPEKEKLILYLIDLLDEKEKMEIEEHLKFCKNCQEELKIEEEIEKGIAYELDPGIIEEKIIRKLQIYNSFPKFHFLPRFLKVFIFSTIIFSLFFALFYFLIGSTTEFLRFFGKDEAKGLLIIFNLLIKEFSHIINTEESKTIMSTISILFFILNFLYAFKKYFFKDKFI